KTICDRAMFLKELEAIRERGYAVMNEEMAAHLVGVAAPVFNKEGYPRYAVSVAGLCFRPVEAFVAEVCDDVVQTAREISEFLAPARTREDK
ncbi:MAG: IclR family transcriptional regulator C-terminal domain-containing protein, partial [Bilophila wadsworthia]